MEILNTLLDLLIKVAGDGDASIEKAKAVAEATKFLNKVELAETIYEYSITGIVSLLGGGAIASLVYGAYHAVKGAQGLAASIAGTAAFWGLRRMPTTAGGLTKTAPHSFSGSAEVQTQGVAEMNYISHDRSPLLEDQALRIGAKGWGYNLRNPGGATVFKGDSVFDRTNVFERLEVDAGVLTERGRFESIVNRVRDGGGLRVRRGNESFDYVRRGDLFFNERGFADARGVWEYTKNSEGGEK
jgi:hypothetical protein